MESESIWDREVGWLKPERLPVAGEFEIALPHRSFCVAGLHRALPVDGAGARARVEFLVVHAGLQHELDRPCPDAHRDRILGLRARRAPAAQGRECDFIGPEYPDAARAVPV